MKLAGPASTGGRLPGKGAFAERRVLIGIEQVKPVIAKKILSRVEEIELQSEGPFSAHTRAVKRGEAGG